MTFRDCRGARGDRADGLFIRSTCVSKIYSAEAAGRNVREGMLLFPLIDTVFRGVATRKILSSKSL